VAAKIIHPPLLPKDISSRIEELQMLKTPFHHRCTHYYTSLISRDIMGFLVTSMADMSLKKCSTLISQPSKIIHPGQNSNIFFGFAFGLAVASVSPLLFRQLAKILV
jgi:hypothetical protein